MRLLTKEENLLLQKINKYRKLSDVVPPDDLEALLSIIDSLHSSLEKHEEKVRLLESKLPR